jgi:hypothetical protein
MPAAPGFGLCRSGLLLIVVACAHFGTVQCHQYVLGCFLSASARLRRSCAAAVIDPVQAPSVQPVWRQVLQLHLDHQDPEVAQQATAWNRVSSS